MGLISFVANGGNFGLIAKNVTAYYKTVKLTPQAKEWTDNKCLFVAGALDLQSYLYNRTIFPEEIETAVYNANIGIIGEAPYTFHVEKPLNMATVDNFKLKCFVMQIEYLIFCNDSQNISNYTVIQQILKKKQTIYKVVDKTLNVKRYSSLYDRLLASTIIKFNSQSFIDFVDEFREPNEQSNTPTNTPTNTPIASNSSCDG